MELEKSICRMCLSSSESVCPLFGSNLTRTLLMVIRNNVGLEIAEDDAFSKMICEQCIAKIKTIEEYIELFRESDRKLRKAIPLKSNPPRQDPSNDSKGEKKETCHSRFATESVELSHNAEAVDKHTISTAESGTKDANNTESKSSRRSKRIRTQAKRLNLAKNNVGTYDGSQTDEEFDCENDSADGSYHASEIPSLQSQLNEKSVTTWQQEDNSLHPINQSLKYKTNRAPLLHDFKCYICSSAPLSSRKALIEHLASHVDKLPYTCKQCVMETIVLTRVRTLNTHMKMHEQPIKCDYCDRRYSNSAGKYYHTHTYHLAGGAPCIVHCTICDKQYGSEAALKQHMKYHTTALKCSKCDMVFNHPNKLRNHEQTHNKERGYECVVCKKVLQTIESYDVHLKKHSQERSYPCTLCPKKFNTSFNLILHLKVHAKNYNYRPAKSWVEHYTILSRDPMQYKCNHCDPYSTDKVNNMISHLQAHFKEYECDQCKRLFATAKQLRAHYTTHTGEKSEMCQHCGKCFSTKNNLRIHLKSHRRDKEASSGVASSTHLTAMQENAP